MSWLLFVCQSCLSSLAHGVLKHVSRFVSFGILGGLPRGIRAQMVLENSSLWNLNTKLKRILKWILLKLLAWELLTHGHSYFYSYFLSPILSWSKSQLICYSNCKSVSTAVLLVCGFSYPWSPISEINNSQVSNFLLFWVKWWNFALSLCPTCDRNHPIVQHIHTVSAVWLLVT